MCKFGVSGGSAANLALAPILLLAPSLHRLVIGRMFGRKFADLQANVQDFCFYSRAEFIRLLEIRA
jgi:hypothetical protein